MKTKENQSDDPVINSDNNTMAYPKNGDCHVRIPQYEWNIISMICDTRACSINEAITWIIRMHIARAKDPELIVDSLVNISANMDDIIIYLEDLQATGDELTTILSQGTL
jgi:hypothetical protein